MFEKGEEEFATRARLPGRCRVCLNNASVPQRGRKRFGSIRKRRKMSADGAEQEKKGGE